MPVRLNQPLSSTPNADENVMLSNLQGNILKGHGRDRTAHVFLRFKPGKAAAARAFLRTYARKKLMIASDQIKAAAIFKREGRASRNPLVTRAFVSIVLSRSGYTALGIPAADTPNEAAFNAGLKSRQQVLQDPPKNTWHTGYRGELHAMILIGGSAALPTDVMSVIVETEIAKLVATAPKAAISFVGIERGRGYRNANHDGIEHFGYVDGRSQPLLTEADIDKELKNAGTVNWDPAFPLSQVLVKDPALADPNVFGSYFVFRKLAQNVKGFKTAEENLQTQLETLATSVGKTFPIELAGAMIVGRFEDGTPVVLQSNDGLSGAVNGPVGNNFGFSNDPNGLKCPFHAHIRKTNPRGDSVALGATLASERSHIMARRGITYGNRKQTLGELQGRPSTGVGLLFMAYQADISRQFEFTEAAWANNENFVRPGTGIDPVLGQSNSQPPQPQKHRAGWNDAGAPVASSLFANFVSLKGGEYFFAPSIAFFSKL